MICLGIESTAHTFGIGIVKYDKNTMKFEVLANERSIFKPEPGKGIKPDEAANHHRENSEKLLKSALEKANLTINDINLVAYSAGPGLPPCLKAGVDFVKTLGKPVIPVNHCIAHIEVAKWKSRPADAKTNLTHDTGDRASNENQRIGENVGTKCIDPVVLYVSGGNTQIIAFAGGRYRVFGETLDIAIGNAIDKFMRDTGGGNPMRSGSHASGSVFPGGPIMATNWKKISQIPDAEKYFIELPYSVKGMDMSFSGLAISAARKYNQNPTQEIFENLCYSFQEIAFAMLTEVTERAMAHTGKTECLVTGGVAASERLKEMLEIMCRERGATFYACPMEYAGDNGAMIAYTGLLYHLRGQPTVNQDKADFRSRWRTDDVDVPQ